MRPASASRIAGVRRLAALVTGALLPLVATPALAKLDDGESQGKSLGTGLVIVIYVLIPLGIFAVIALLLDAAVDAAPAALPPRPGLDSYDPMWFNGPDDPDKALTGGATGRDSERRRKCRVVRRSPTRRSARSAAPARPRARRAGCTTRSTSARSTATSATTPSGCMPLSARAANARARCSSRRSDRQLEIVTGKESSRRLSDRSCALAALSMTTSFAGGDLVGGIVTGVRMLAESAGRELQPGRALAPGASVRASLGQCATGSPETAAKSVARFAEVGWGVSSGRRRWVRRARAIMSRFSTTSRRSAGGGCWVRR